MLLSRSSKSICLMATMFYGVFMLPALFNNIESFYQPQSTTDLSGIISTQGRVIIGGLTGTYMGAVLWNVSRFLTLHRLKSSSVSAVTRLNVLIGAIAAASSLFTTAFGYGGMVDDYFG